MKLISLAVSIAAIVGVGFLIDARYQDDLSSARADAKAARGIANAAIAVSVIAQDAADSARARADAAELRADSLETRAARSRIVYRTLSQAAPDTCRPALGAADLVIAQKDSVIAEKNVAIASLRFALDTTTRALVQLRGATVKLNIATEHLEKASKRSLFAKLLPRPGAGVAAGVDAHGRPALIAGITLGYTF
jgi:hypothetical protein